LEALLDRVAKAGYGVATGEAYLLISRMVEIMLQDDWNELYEK